MVITPFEQSSFNLVSFADATVDLFDSTPKDVAIQLKDSNGNVSTTTMANRGKFKQQIWNDVGSALGQFYRTFYVDATNGDDTNDGSSSNPFKTIKKAVDSVPVGGTVYINLAEGQTYPFNSDITALNKVIYILGSLVNKPIIKVNSTSDSNVNYSYTFVLKNSSMYMYGLEFETASKSDNSLPWDSGIKRATIISYSGGGSVALNDCHINIPNGNSNFALSSYYGGITLYTSSCTITRDDGAILDMLGFTPSILGSYSTNINDSDGNSLSWLDVINNIKRDSNNIPRNIISNIVL